MLKLFSNIKIVFTEKHIIINVLSRKTMDTYNHPNEPNYQSIQLERKLRPCQSLQSAKDVVHSSSFVGSSKQKDF